MMAVLEASIKEIKQIEKPKSNGNVRKKIPWRCAGGFGLTVCSRCAIL
jgi:hypothetical protein